LFNTIAEGQGQAKTPGAGGLGRLGSLSLFRLLPRVHHDILGYNRRGGGGGAVARPHQADAGTSERNMEKGQGMYTCVSERSFFFSFFLGAIFLLTLQSRVVSQAIGRIPLVYNSRVLRRKLSPRWEAAVFSFAQKILFFTGPRLLHFSLASVGFFLVSSC
jgi:hypothetical protein